MNQSTAVSALWTLSCRWARYLVTRKRVFPDLIECEGAWNLPLPPSWDRTYEIDVRPVATRILISLHLIFTRNHEPGPGFHEPSCGSREVFRSHHRRRNTYVIGLLELESQARTVSSSLLLPSDTSFAPCLLWTIVQLAWLPIHRQQQDEIVSLVR